MSDTVSGKSSLQTLSLKRDTSAPKLKERLQKVLAQAGLGSRRALEQRIADGLIKVNGIVAEVGMSVQSGDRIECDGRTFVASALNESVRVLIYNKPEGQITTRDDPEGRPTVFDALPALNGARWISIGRLDINTSGLLLLTTDGELANAMMHPSFEIDREYVVRVRPPEGAEHVSDALTDRLIRGVALEDGPAKFDLIERKGSTDSHDWFRVVIKEGRNREVRRLWESQGCQVSRLKRIRYGSILLPRELLRGQSIDLPASQVERLRMECHLEDNTPSVLTLQPVIGQRRASRSTVHVNRNTRSQGAYVNGVSADDEGRELRRFDTFREERVRGRKKSTQYKEGLTVSGESAAKQAQTPFKQRKAKSNRFFSNTETSSTAFRSWYVPDGVNTGPSRSGHTHANKKKNVPSRHTGETDSSSRYMQHSAASVRKHPYGHPGNAPVFPSDHATPESSGVFRQPHADNRPGRRSPHLRKRGPR